MELRTTRELRRNERLTKAMVKEKEGKGAAAPVQPKPARQAADKLTLSRQALGYLQEQSRLAWEREQRRQSRMDDSFSALDTAKDQLDAMEKKLKVMNKCQKIAASIMRGGPGAAGGYGVPDEQRPGGLQAGHGHAPGEPGPEGVRERAGRGGPGRGGLWGAGERLRRGRGLRGRGVP